MALITSIDLKNFRGFRNSGKIRLAPLTFVVGPNSSGKSTISNALLFIAQSYTSQKTVHLSIDWMGRYVDLGSFRDTVYKHDTALAISIEIGMQYTNSPYINSKSLSGPKNETLLKWEIKDAKTTQDKESFSSGRVATFTLTDVTSGANVKLTTANNFDTLLINGDKIKFEGHIIRSSAARWRINSTIAAYLNSPVSPLTASMAGYRRVQDAYTSQLLELFFGDFERVSSARSGPKRWVAKGTLASAGPTESGVLSDPYAITTEAVHSRQHKRGTTYRDSISSQLKKLGIATSLRRVDLSAYHSSLQITDSVSDITSNLADVGFGISQVIPVIRGCTNNSWSPLIIEQPEIHLHPKAQSGLAELIGESSIDRQIFVETHSEHMINKARIMVLEGKLDPKNIQILYVDKSNSGSKVIEIGITSNGDFTREWPEGFFDERYNDTMALMSLRSKTSEVIRATAQGRKVATPRKNKV